MITEVVYKKEIKKKNILDPLCYGSSHVEVLFEKLFLKFTIKGTVVQII